MSGGGRSAEDAQSGQRDHMQRKNHLPSRRCAAYPCVRVRRAEQSGAERSHQRTAFPLAPPPRRVRRSLMLEEHNRSHDDSASLSLSLSPRQAQPTSLSLPLFFSLLRACVRAYPCVCVCVPLSPSPSLFIGRIRALRWPSGAMQMEHKGSTEGKKPNAAAHKQTHSAAAQQLGLLVQKKNTPPKKRARSVGASADECWDCFNWWLVGGPRPSRTQAAAESVLIGRT